MRWFWIDRFIEFESGKRAVAVKNISMCEEHVMDYVPGFGVMPNSLIIEGLAQTGGLLVGETSGFKERVVLAKVSKALFHDYALPGDQLTYTAIIENLQPDGAIVQCISYRGDRVQAEVDIMFAHLDDRFEGVELFYPRDFIGMLRSMRLYEVARDADGNSLKVPEHLLAAEATLFQPNADV